MLCEEERKAQLSYYCFIVENSHDVLHDQPCFSDLLNFVVLRQGHEMVTGEAESRCLMEFWATHLHRRLVAMEGNATVYEIQ